MKNPMIRGEAAPMGFAQSVSSWLRGYAYREKAQRPALNGLRRAQLIDAAAGLPLMVGDEDPRIRTLFLASEGGRWEPTGQQLAAVQGAAHRLAGEPHELDPEDLLNNLAHGAVLDLATIYDRKLAHVKKSPEASPTQEVILLAERERADNAQRQVRELRVELASQVAAAMREKTHRRELEAIVRGEPSPELTERDRVPVPKGERSLPEGIRPKGNGYQASFKRGGRTFSRILPTLEEAVRWRADAIGLWERDNAAREAQNPPEFNLSPEELQAMREQAAA